MPPRSIPESCRPWARTAWSRLCLLLAILPVLHSCNRHSRKSTTEVTAKDRRPVTHLPAESVGWTQIVNSLVAIFDDVDIVALGETHGRKMDSDLRLRLIRAPAFSLKVRFIVMESANSLYQPILDRYIRGDDIPLSDFAQAWRNIVSVRGADSKVYEDFFATVRDVNRSLPTGRRLRVVAADPPIDWKQVHARSDIEPFLERRGFPVSLGQTAVKKGEKALVIYGNAHIARPQFPLWAAGTETQATLALPPVPTGTPSFVRAIEVSGPDRVFTVHSCPGAEPGRVLLQLTMPVKPLQSAVQYDACFFDGEPDADSIIGPDASLNADVQYATEVARRLRAFQSSR
jgi:Haem-binding uptake, Tiki superfamily, ChaN